MPGVILIVQICLAPLGGGVLLQGCVHRTVEAEDCGTAMALVGALIASDRVAVPGGCVPVIAPSSGRAPPPGPRR